MINVHKWVVLTTLVFTAIACTDSDENAGPESTTGGSAGTIAGTAGSSGSQTGPTGGSGGSSGSGSSSTAGTAGGTGAQSGSSGTSGAGGTGGFSGSSGTAGSGGAGGNEPTCVSAHEELLGSVDTISSGQFLVLSEENGAVLVYIDASAGGPQEAPNNPFIYINLSTRAKVEVTDKSSLNSDDWDIGLKRANLVSNSGDGGPGSTVVAFLPEVAFDEVTLENTQGITFSKENFLDDQCQPLVDEGGYPLTSFYPWFSYDPTTHQLSPAPGTFVIQRLNGDTHKLSVETYYGTPEGGTSMSGGHFLIRLANIQ